MENNVAYCGLDCEQCEAYIATVNDDDELRKEVAKRWSEWNAVEITPETIDCDGCRGTGKKIVYCASLCPVRQCALGKKYETCADCSVVKTCDKAGAVFNNNEQARKNLFERQGAVGGRARHTLREPDAHVPDAPHTA